MSEPSLSLKRATKLFNNWVSDCLIRGLGPEEQGALLIQMITEALDERQDVEGVDDDTMR